MCFASSGRRGENRHDFDWCFSLLETKAKKNVRICNRSRNDRGLGSNGNCDPRAAAAGGEDP